MLASSQLLGPQEWVSGKVLVRPTLVTLVSGYVEMKQALSLGKGGTSSALWPDPRTGRQGQLEW